VGKGYSAPVKDDAVKRAADILETTGAREGYCLALGLADGRLLEELAAQSDLHVIGIDADAAKIDRIRRSIPESVYGERVAVICADPATVKLPPYLATLVVSEDVKSGGYTGGQGDHIRFVRQAHDVLRPYGGAACFDEQKVGVRVFARLALSAEFDDVRLDADVEKQLVLMRRTGPLKGAADWTHQYADAANSVVSDDDLVKLPLGVLWFGGSTHWDILPRHGHGPVEQVVGGRLFIEGPNTLRASDVYTGRVLWRRELPGIGKAYDNTDHQPGANAIGANFASARDALYVIRGDNCLRLDPTTGETLSVFTVPSEDPGASELFGFVSVSGDVLVTGVTPLVLEWDPLFRREEFSRVISERRLDDMVAIIAEWPAGPLVPQREGQKTLDYVVENLNAVLNERQLESRVPEAVLATAGETEKALAVRAHLAAYRLLQQESLKYDTELRRLNRELLQLLYPNIPRAERGEPGWFNWDYTSSREIVALDRHTGKVLWRRRARLGFRHNTIVSGGGKVYAVDALPGPVLDALKRRGETPTEEPRLLALDLATGSIAWTDEDNVFGTWLGYSAEHDVLVQSGRTSRDMLWGEPDNSMSAHRAADGSLLWNRDRWHHGPVMLHGRSILTQSDGYDLLTGDEVTWTNPLTGLPEEWRYQRMYGCNSPVASRNLLSFRSAAAGFYDLAGLGGTGNLGGFKSGCSSNLIAADGVLNAPDYTRTCTCSYQNQTSLAFVHMPEVELWTFNPIRVGPHRVERIGINLGAPGDRRDADGTLWIEYPVVGGPSPAVRVRTEPDDVAWYYRHSLRLSGDGKKWVAASGAKGIRKLTVTLCRPVHVGGLPFVLSFPRRYTVRLHFAEPDGLKPGDRVFDVWVQGKKTLEGVDVSAAAGGPERPAVRDCRSVEVDSELEIRLEPSAGSRVREPILSGIEIIAEDW
ncbi:MAG TPA: PQQ-binding-like beta-propeller repeat protein, partial [Planctomycetota bacterium]|nr:PQQ-binding-like beta-propeller repeat protein [Planctomycetota bacterium]